LITRPALPHLAVGLELAYLKRKSQNSLIPKFWFLWLYQLSLFTHFCIYTHRFQIFGIQQSVGMVFFRLNLLVLEISLISQLMMIFFLKYWVTTFALH
jgi:hypothetical protein